MASQPGQLYEFPWSSWGNAKYALFAPFVAAAALGLDDGDNWAWHMCVIAALRYAHAAAWNTASRLHAISAKHRIYGKGVEFKQVDREADWDDYILLQLLVMTAVHRLPLLNFSGWPLVHRAGLLQVLLLHVGPTEFIYYWLHRALHWHPLYQRYHSHHHASFVTEPISGSCHPFAEHLMYTANFAIPLLGTWAAGGASWLMFYAYLLGFDFLNAIGHCNFEFVPSSLYLRVPLLKYLIYTPTFHSLHHSQVKTNFCLFMPVYDYWYGTVDPKSESLYLKARAGEAVPVETPDCVFMGHGTELLSVFHLPFMSRGLSAHPYRAPLWMYALWPLTLPLVGAMMLFGRPFVADKHQLGKLNIETWSTPAWGFEFFLRSRWAAINRHIRTAIVEADRAGVRVIGLGALNKNEALNGGGRLFVDALPDLRVRVVHGNTLTAAAILRKLPLRLQERKAQPPLPAAAAACRPQTRRQLQQQQEQERAAAGGCGSAREAGAGADAGEEQEVFLTGATSKLGRALALYLSERGVRVRMLTASAERFDAIAAEATTAAQRALLVRAERLEDGAASRIWLVGKHLTAAQQALAPAGAEFHQFVVPPISPARADCVYTGLPAFKVPREAKGFRSCEMTMPRRVVHACHAGALVHALEGWTHHEVGAVDHTRIDEVWDAAAKHGFLMA